MNQIEVEITSISDEKLGVVTSEVVLFGTGIFRATAGSRTSGPDFFDPVIGERLAVARALKQISRSLEKAARQEVQKRDRVRERAEALRVAKVAERKENAKKYHPIPGAGIAGPPGVQGPPGATYPRQDLPA